MQCIVGNIGDKELLGNSLHYVFHTVVGPLSGNKSSTERFTFAQAAIEAGYVGTRFRLWSDQFGLQSETCLLRIIIRTVGLKYFEMIKQGAIPVYEHLYEIYPQMPKYANDPQQSQIIFCYDLLLKRFQGIYGRDPKYFVRSPASCLALGSAQQVYQMSTVSFCSLQNVIVAIALNGHSQLRFNHYQSAVYGEKVFENEAVKWKYDEKNDEYVSLLMCCLKAYSTLFNLHTFQGVDVLIYDDFIQDVHLHARQAICLGIAAALHSIYVGKGEVTNLKEQFCHKFLAKVSNLTHFVKPVSFSTQSTFNQFAVAHPSQPQGAPVSSIDFPEQYEMIIAHSMTPMPKKLIQGKRENLRRCEVLIGIEIIKNEIGATNNISSLGQLKKYLNCSTSELLQTVHECVPQEDLTAERIEQITEKSLIEILKLIPYANNVIDQNAVYRPYKRIKYFLEQQLLIEQLTSQNLVDSLAKSYDNSIEMLQIGSEQLTDMVSVVKSLAVAWRIVGHGWGGYLCIVCEKGKGSHIAEALVQEFYMHANNKVLLSDDIEQYVKIVGKPASGLCVLDPASQIWY